MTTQPLTVLDPTMPATPVNAKLAGRPPTLDGKVIGLLDNHKRNAAEFLEEVRKLLAERYEFKGVVKATKPDVSRPCPTQTAEQLAAECDLVITGLGD